ncbi:MAG: sensor histidine kinase [Acidimicrobiales bacterium]
MTDLPPGAATVGLEELPDPTVLLDGRRLVVELNADACRLLRRPPDELVGRALADSVGARDADGRPLWESGWGDAARLRSVRLVTEQLILFRRPDGRDQMVAATAAYRRDAAGTITGAVVSLRDLRRRARGERAVETVSTVSHELRAPLTSVKGYTSLLLERWDRIGDDDKRAMLAQVHHDAERVTRLLAELLDISRLESGRLALRRRRVDLPALADDVVRRVRLEHPDLTLRTDWEKDLPLAWADPDKVEQVLTNLVENACKYASPRDLTLRGGREDTQVWVSVGDHGEGIPAEDLPRVFTKFFRRDRGRPTGSGLGLWISRGLVEAHGGRLEATSKLGEGSTFRLTLPAS